MKASLTQVSSCIFALILVPVGLLSGATDDATTTNDYLEMDLEELMEVDISVASKKLEPLTEAPGVVSVVPHQEFITFGDRNLWQLMQRQPSVFPGRSFAFGQNLLAFRGDSAIHQERHTLTLLNGRPIRESALGDSVPVYTALPLTSLENVEVIRGPGSVLYGTNAFTGVVNLNSRPIPDETTVSISGMGGSYGYYDTTLSVGGRPGPVGFVTDLRVVGQDGWPYRLTDVFSVYDEDVVADKSIAGTAHLEHEGLTFDCFAADVDIFTMGSSPSWSNPRQSRAKRLFANLGYRLPIHERVDLDFNVTYNLQESVQATLGPERVGTNTSDVLGEVTLLANPLDRLNVLFGLVQEYRSNYSVDDEYYASIQPYHYEPTSLYGQIDYTLGKTAKFIAGTQWNESTIGGSGFVSRYGVILTPHERWGVKLLRGEAFRGPLALESDLADLRGAPYLVYVGNKDLRPETIATYDAQLFFNSPNTYAAVTYFDSTTSDTIVYGSTSPSEATFVNGGSQEFRGIEFEAKRILSKRWHILGSFTHQESDTDPGIPPSRVPENMLKVGAAHTWEGGSAAIFCTHCSTPPGDPAVDALNPAPEAFTLVSMNVRLDLAQWLGGRTEQKILTLRAENLLDQDVYTPNPSSFGSYPYGPGLTVYAGLTYNF